MTKESEKERRRLASGQGLLPFGKIWTDLQRGIAKAFVLTANAAGAERRDADGDGRQPGAKPSSSSSRRRSQPGDSEGPGGAEAGEGWRTEAALRRDLSCGTLRGHFGIHFAM